MTLNEYIDLEKSCRSLTKDIEGLSNNLAKLKTDLEEQECSYKDKLQSISGNKENYIRDRIRTEVESAIMGDTSTCREKEICLSKLSTKNYKVDLEPIKDYYSDYINLLVKVKKDILGKRREYGYIVQLIEKSNLKLDSEDILDKLYVALEKYQKELSYIEEVDNSVAISNVVTKWLFKGASLSKFLKGSSKVIYILAYYLIFLLTVFLFPELLFGYTAILCTVFLVKNTTLRKRQISLIKKLELHNNLCKELEKLISQRVRMKADKLLQESKKVDIKAMERLNFEISELKESITKKSEIIKNNILTSSNSSEYETQQRGIVTQEFFTPIEELKEQIGDLNALYEESVEEQGVLKAKRDAGKLELEDTYFKLDKIGNGKLLPRKFLLGFNEYLPLTLDMSEYAINLPANMRANDSVIKFVYMCIVQMLCTTNPSCIDITVVDLVNGTSNFGMLGFLDKIVKLVTTEEGLNKVIQDFYEIKTERDTSIKSRFDNITEYNEYMISQYGITMPYKILIITHHVESLFVNTMFRQIQNSGDVGLVTITVWDKNMFSYDSKRKVEYYKNLLEYIPFMKNTSYFGDNGELSILDDAYIRSRVKDITLQLRGK